MGQEAIATTLTNAINSAKIAPAYLFTGPRGTGKTSSARILAKSLNCLNSDKPTAQPCGVCDTCQGITKGYTLDVIEIDAASNTGVDNIREIIERAQFAPVQCRYKVYVIDECHMLSTAAFNALLKTLEEPPKHVVFVLATTDPQRVLPTIISRCQRFDFRRIQLEAMVKHLSNIAANENIQISPDAVTLVAQLSQGGLRDAESLLDQLALLSGEVRPHQVWDLVGSVSEQDLLGLLEAIAQDHPETVLDCTRKILDRGREPLTILQNLAAFYKDLLIAKTAPNRQDLVACTKETWQALVSFAHKLEITTILQGQQHLRSAEVQLKNTTQPHLWLEVTLLGLLPSANIPTKVLTLPPQINTPAAPAINSSPPVNHPQPSQNPAVPAHTPLNSQPHHFTHSSVPSPAATHTPVNENSRVHSVAATVTQPHQTAATQPVTPTTTETLAPSVEQIPPQENLTQPQFDLNQIWQQVCTYIPQGSTKSLLSQMSHLADFDGQVARVAIKAAWYERYKSSLPAIITGAFQQVYQREIQVFLEKATGATATSARSYSSPQDSTRVQQPPTSIYKPQITSPAPIPTPTPTPPPSPPPVPTPTPQPARIEPPVTKTVPVPTTPPPQPKPSPSNWDHDEVKKAAESLADFFKGQIIRLDDDAMELPDAIAVTDLEVYEYDDD
ncbi:DNA polymerase III, subunits gamma and tau [Richelia sinica FACHB-800]|uniref:DNA polymerase III subunit gamma/tau n=1 Tax=Richelia sinica FACHB-800 TaxID=1357546 RepID=A0A975T8J9_9NOST|nr:DNA polymerase III, subunits gamma and tau [Richelia sinica FACHB-800]